MEMVFAMGTELYLKDVTLVMKEAEAAKEKCGSLSIEDIPCQELETPAAGAVRDVSLRSMAEMIVQSRPR